MDESREKLLSINKDLVIGQKRAREQELPVKQNYYAF